MPKYVLKDKEAVYIDDPNNKLTKLKMPLLIIVGIIIIGSFFFKESLFSEMNWSARVFLVLLCLIVFFCGGQKKEPHDIELRFYDDHLELLKPKHPYNKNFARQELYRFRYDEIKQIQYRTKTHKINIYGNVETIWWDYNSDGTLPPEPTHHKTVDSIAYFYTDFLENGNIVEIIENNCPIKVSVENN